MAANLDILIKAIDQASGPINGVKNALGGLNSTATNTVNKGLGQLRSALGGALVGGAVAGGAALGGLAAAVGVTGVNFNDLKQQADIAFTTMLGSGEKAKAFLDDLQDFAAKTPFEFPDLLSASQRLLAMGFAADEVRPTLTAIGDAVAGLGGGSAEVDRVTTALGQMNAKGKASAEEIMQLTEAGIPAWQMLADAIGVDVATAMDQVSKGTVSADVAIAAIVDGMNTRFGGMMEKQSATWGGLTSTLMDTFTQVSGTITGPVFGKLTEGLAAIVAWTSKPEFTAGVERFAQWLGTVADQAIEWSKSLVPVLQAAGVAFRGVVDILSGTEPLGDWSTWFMDLEEIIGGEATERIIAFGEQLYDIRQAILDMVQPVVNLIAQFVSWEDVLKGVAIVIGVAAVQALAAFLAAMAPVALTVGGAIAAMALLRHAWENDWGGIQGKTEAVMGYLDKRFGVLGETIKTFGGQALGEIKAFVTGNETEFTALGKIWDAAKDAGRGLFADIVDSAKRIGQPFLDWFEKTFPGAAEAARKAFADISEKLGALMTALSNLFSGEGERMGQMLTALRQWWDEHGAAIMRIVDNTFKTVITIISAAVQVITGLVTLVVQILSGDWRGAWETAQGIVTTVWDTIVAVTRTQLDSLKTLILTILSSISDSMRQKAAEWVDKLLEGLASLGSRAWQLLTDAISFMLSPMDGLWEKFKNFGTNAVQGFIDGVGGLIGQAQAKVAELMALAQQAAAYELDAHSPSREWAKLGRWSGEGYLEGLAQSLRGVGGAMAAALPVSSQTYTTYNTFNAYVSGTGNAGGDVLRQIEFYNAVYGGA